MMRMPKNAKEFEEVRDRAIREVEELRKDGIDNFSDYISSQLEARGLPGPDLVGVHFDIHETNGSRSFGYEVVWNVAFYRELSADQRRELDLIPPSGDRPIRYVSILNEDEIEEVVLEKR